MMENNDLFSSNWNRNKAELTQKLRFLFSNPAELFMLAVLDLCIPLWKLVFQPWVYWMSDKNKWSSENIAIVHYKNRSTAAIMKLARP